MLAIGHCKCGYGKQERFINKNSRLRLWGFIEEEFKWHFIKKNFWKKLYTYTKVIFFLFLLFIIKVGFHISVLQIDSIKLIYKVIPWGKE